jgi:hypothetical protein
MRLGTTCTYTYTQIYVYIHTNTHVHTHHIHTHDVHARTLIHTFTNTSYSHLNTHTHIYSHLIHIKTLTHSAPAPSQYPGRRVVGYIVEFDKTMVWSKRMTLAFTSSECGEFVCVCMRGYSLFDM